MRNFIFASLIILLAGACTPKKKVDLVVLHANIYTLDQDRHVYSCMVVNEGKIVLLSNDSIEIKKKYTTTQWLRLNGKFIYPGLIDAHSHFYGLGQSLVTVDLRGSASEADMIEKVKNFYQGKIPSIISGRGWDQNTWPGKKFPGKKELDLLYPDIPVCLGRIDGHAMLVNQKTLDLAGINKDTKINGGEVIQQNGELTGVITDNVIEHVNKHLPPPHKEEIKEALVLAEKKCFSYGLTTVCDAGLDKSIIDIYDEMHKNGELKIRIYAMANPTQPTLGWLLENGPYKTERLHVRSVKYYMDGSMGSRGACLMEDYEDQPGHKGFLLNPPDSLLALALRLKEKNLQLNVHCIGDSANRITLKVMAEVLGKDTTSRWRIEHVQLISKADLEKFRTCRIIPSMQPTHATSDGPWVMERIGNRAEMAYCLKTLLEYAGCIALGTDFPVEEVNPFYTFYSAITRKNPVTHAGLPWKNDQALTRDQALLGMTGWAAYAQFEEKEKGSLEPGKLADFIVLNGDLFQVPEKDIPLLLPEKVFCGGELVFQQP